MDCQPFVPTLTERRAAWRAAWHRACEAAAIEAERWNEFARAHLAETGHTIDLDGEHDDLERDSLQGEG